jgi:hypothetical protein
VGIVPRTTDRRGKLRAFGGTLGLRDEFSRQSRVHRLERRVEFLGERDGVAEGGLKRELILEFTTRPAIQRAYLAQLGYQLDGAPAVGLCLVSSQPDDQSLIRRVSDIFARMFSKDAELDVLFLTPEQELDLKRVCQPFYSRAI